MARQLVALLIALGLITVAATARAADVNQTAQLTRRLKLAAVLPAIWMGLQAIYSPRQLAHSIWASAAASLQENLWGQISVDPGATILALFGYLAGVILVVLTIFVTRDRRRAELLLQALCAITVFAVIGLVMARLGNLVPFEVTATNTAEALPALSALGIILCLSAVVRVVERYESRRRSRSVIAPDDIDRHNLGNRHTRLRPGARERGHRQCRNCHAARRCHLCTGASHSSI